LFSQKKWPSTVDGPAFIQPTRTIPFYICRTFIGVKLKLPEPSILGQQLFSRVTMALAINCTVFNRRIFVISFQIYVHL